MYNKEGYKEILDYFKQDLELVYDEIKSLLFENKNRINNEVEAFLFSKSKRLRPVVIFLIKDCLNIKDNIKAKGVDKKIAQLATALELLHSATLIHDDIIDCATIRRGQETFDYRFNSKIAVIAGDYLLSLSLKLLSKLNSTKVFEYFSENTLNICMGEINQYFNKNNIITIDEYIEKSKNKTSSLFMAGAKSALYIINKEFRPVSDEVRGAIIDFVLNFSLGFQIYDDIENFLNKNTEKTSSDIENGIYTLPYLYISQQNNSCDIIKDEKLNTLAADFSKNYLNNTLNKAIKSLDGINSTCKTSLLIKLAEIFKEI